MEPTDKIVTTELSPHVQFAVVDGHTSYRFINGAHRPTGWARVPKISAGETSVLVGIQWGHGVMLEFARIDGVMAVRFRCHGRKKDWQYFTEIKQEPTEESPMTLLVPWIAA